VSTTKSQEVAEDFAIKAHDEAMVKMLTNPEIKNPGAWVYMVKVELSHGALDVNANLASIKKYRLLGVRPEEREIAVPFKIEPSHIESAYNLRTGEVVYNERFRN
jgi:hypothetical protein